MKELLSLYSIAMLTKIKYYKELLKSLLYYKKEIKSKRHLDFTLKDLNFTLNFSTSKNLRIIYFRKEKEWSIKHQLIVSNSIMTKIVQYILIGFLSFVQRFWGVKLFWVFFLIQRKTTTIDFKRKAKHQGI